MKILLSLKWYLLLTVSWLLCVPAWTSPAAEIDTISLHDIALPDSRDRLNDIINQRLEEGVENANKRQTNVEIFISSDPCDPEILYTELRKAIFQSITAAWGLKGYGLDKQLRELLAENSHALALEDSIYRDIDYIEGLSLNLKELSDIVNINGYMVGLDKIGHFFAEGYRYFEIVNVNGASPEDGLEWGKEKESGLFGYATTGIFSFADLTANFDGYRFWNRILLERGDPLKNILERIFDSPYVSCDFQFFESLKNWRHTKRWTIKKSFDIADYIDGAWDEAHNCNSYATPAIEEKVTARIKQIDPDYSCPAVPEICVAAKQKYGDFARRLLHPQCLTAENK